MSAFVNHQPLSPSAQKGEIALLETGVEFDAAQPADLGSGAQTEEFAVVQDGLDKDNIGFTEPFPAR